MTDLVHLAGLNMGTAKWCEPREGDTLKRFLPNDCRRCVDAAALSRSGRANALTAVQFSGLVLTVSFP
jgi:hypothetical protein